mgnify:CR=1 FL=1
MRRYELALTCVWIAATLGARDACAHRLIQDDGTHTSPASAIALEDFELSQVVYHEVRENSNQLWFTFDAVAGQTLHWELGLPALERLDGYRPSLMILGPGLPEIEAPFEIPEGLGGLVVEVEAEPELFFEPFTGTSSWKLSSGDRSIAQDGTYYVVAYYPEGTPGKFWVALGKREEFGLRDVLGYADTIAFVREYHEDSAAPLSVLNWVLLAVSYLAKALTGPFIPFFSFLWGW